MRKRIIGLVGLMSLVVGCDIVEPEGEVNKNIDGTTGVEKDSTQTTGTDEKDILNDSIVVFEKDSNHLDDSTNIIIKDNDSIIIVNPDGSGVIDSSGNQYESCAEIYSPVCQDGITFENECSAQNAGYTNTQKGSCEDDIDSSACPAIYAPVCQDGITFSNVCEAEVLGYSNAIEGECETIIKDIQNAIDSSITGLQSSCNEVYMPVCAQGVTFDNTCEAKFAGLTPEYEGECQATK